MMVLMMDCLTGKATEQPMVKPMVKHLEALMEQMMDLKKDHYLALTLDRMTACLKEEHLV